MIRLSPFAVLLLTGCSATGGNAGTEAAGPSSANGVQVGGDHAQACVAHSGSYEHCATWGPQEHLQGVWVSGFETSGFVPGAMTMPVYAEHGWSQIHLDLAATAQPDPIVLMQRNGASQLSAIAVDFYGRHVAVPGHYGPVGSADMVIVDRVVSMRFLGTIPH